MWLAECFGGDCSEGMEGAGATKSADEAEPREME